MPAKHGAPLMISGSIFTTDWLTFQKIGQSCDVARKAPIGGILLVALFQFFANPIWIAAQIEDCKHLNFIAVLAIINTKWEAARRHSMKLEMKRMNSAEKPEALDVGQQRTDAILADTRLLRFVEISGSLDVLSGVG